MQHGSIVEYILEHGCVTVAQLTDRFGIRARTVRERIRRANNALSGMAVIRFSRSRNGYVLDVADADAFFQWRERVGAFGARASSSSARIAYLTNDLLLRDTWVTLDELADILFVSRACISNDLKQVESTFAQFGLALRRRPHYGIRVDGSEESRRLCLAQGAVRDLVARADEAQGADALELRLAPLMKSISALLDNVLAAENFPLNSFSHQNLLVHLGIAAIRMQDGNYVPTDVALPTEIYGTWEYEVARKIALALGSELGCELPEGEVTYIAIHLAGKRVLGSSDVEDPDRIVISDTVWNTVTRMLDAVWESFRFDFRDDVELRMNLARHIMPLAVRLTHNLHLDNPLLTDIKKRYPLAYAMAGDASLVLAEEYGRVPSEEECGYIALAFALALERRKDKAPKKRLLVVCASGAGSARLLSYKMQEEFGEHLDSITTCTVSQVSGFDFSAVDYVVTTVPLPCAVPVPVREVTLFLDETDRHRVRSLLEYGDTFDLAACFPRELFFPHSGLSSREEVISFVCARASTFMDLPENLEELVWQRERCAPTAFGNGVAIPHPFGFVSDTTFVSVVLLDAPVDWDGQDVQAVFFTSVASDADESINVFYRAVTSMLSDASSIKELISCQTYDQLIDELERRE